MYAIIGFLFCLVLGIAVATQGIAALLWLPLGFAFSLYATAQIILPILMGLPHAIRLIAKGEMRSAVIGRILIAPLTWVVILFAAGFTFGLLWPAATELLHKNIALNLGCWLGVFAIFISPLSKKGRADFRADFDRSYGRFYTNFGTSNELPPVARITMSKVFYIVKSGEWLLGVFEDRADAQQHMDKFRDKYGDIVITELPVEPNSTPFEVIVEILSGTGMRMPNVDILPSGE